MVVKFNDADPTGMRCTRSGCRSRSLPRYYVRVGSSSHQLARYFLIKEFRPDLIRKLLVNHPDLVEQQGKPDPERAGAADPLLDPGRLAGRGGQGPRPAPGRPCRGRKPGTPG